jgi:hypothetical protein
MEHPELAPELEVGTPGSLPGMTRLPPPVPPSATLLGPLSVPLPPPVTPSCDESTRMVLPGTPAMTSGQQKLVEPVAGHISSKSFSFALAKSTQLQPTGQVAPEGHVIPLGKQTFAGGLASLITVQQRTQQAVSFPGKWSNAEVSLRIVSN